MNLRNTFLITVILFSIISCKKSEKKSDSDNIKNDGYPTAVQMGNSILENYPDIWMFEGDTIPRWTYTYGLVALSMLDLWKVTNDQRYYNYAKKYVDQTIDSNGVIFEYNKKEYNIDRVNSGKVLFTFYEKTGDKRYKIVLDTLRQQLREHPRTKNGGFWHKLKYTNQMWLDGLYMGAPFYAHYGLEFNEPEDFDDVTNWITQMEKVARDPKTGLLYHGWDESMEQKWADKRTGLSPNFWGRGMGWYAMALVDVLDYIPQDYAKRDSIIAIIKRLAPAITKYQDPQKGVWCQVVDQGGREGNFLEGSASVMFTYFLFKAVDKGYINAKYQENAIRGFEGIRKNLMKVNSDGVLVISPVCAVAGLGGEPYRDGSYEYYINEARRDNDPKAVGPYIMAAIYYDKYQAKK